MQWNPNTSMRKIEGCQWALIYLEKHINTRHSVCMNDGKSNERKTVSALPSLKRRQFDKVRLLLIAQHARKLTENYMRCACLYGILDGATISIRKQSIMANKYLKIAMRRTPISCDAVEAFQLFNFIGIGLLMPYTFIRKLLLGDRLRSTRRALLNKWIAANYLRFIHRTYVKAARGRYLTHSCGHAKYIIHILHTVLIGSEKLQHISSCLLVCICMQWAHFTK